MAEARQHDGTPLVKTCTVCGKTYTRSKGYGFKQWAASTTCSRYCSMAKGRANREWKPLAERFAEKVDTSPGQGPDGVCHEWQGHKIKWGYGSFKVGDGVKKAHRIAYELAHGPVPTGMLVKHSCDNPPCCNPAHLSLGTHTGNMAEMIKRGRKRNRGDGRLPRIDGSDDRLAMPVPGDLS
ncbi:MULTISPECIES: HNH endonuclease signature motif containing protein [unclassified Aurantimonas]|uniref:HNH endonuclease signature motif containing protein n=1 Tax=unclassified Aurantimonas TaxID=2638230 RepID=UPI002E18A0D7|nr:MULTISPECIES: HNH endonuclease signature motif containing protein [unclassified Aurantimonas]MEC5289398.1 HNH endonuclease signature motif containing protein [Aurantimonas sp. C2-3-R2]